MKLIHGVSKDFYIGVRTKFLVRRIGFYYVFLIGFVVAFGLPHASVGQLPSVVQRGMSGGYAAANTDSTQTKKDKMLEKDYRIMAYNTDFVHYLPVADTTRLTPTDTTLHGFWQQKPHHINHQQYSNLGTMASPQQPILYNPTDDFSKNTLNLGSRFEHLPNINPEKINYFNTNIPITDIFVMYSGKLESEQIIKILHTQNINKNTNLGFVINRHDAQNYLNSNKISQMNGMSFFGKHYNPKNQHHFSANFTYNKNTNPEGGGLPTDVSLLTPIAWGNLRLPNAQSTQRTRSLCINNHRDFGKSNGIKTNAIYHNLRITTGYQQFKSQPNTVFFRTQNYSTLPTNDSTKFTQIKNEIGIYISTINIKITHNLLHHTQFVVFDSATYATQNPRYHQNASIFAQKNTNLYNRYLIYNTAEITAAGYGAGAYKLYSAVELYNTRFLPKIAVFATATPPNVLMQNNYSNHFSWVNDFKNQRTIGIEASASYKKNFELMVQLSNIKHQLYYDYQALPQQNTNNIWLLQASIRHQFTLWSWLNFSGYNALQLSNNDATLPLPVLSTSNSIYIGKRLKKGYTAYIGGDIRYNTDYYTPKYQPATGVFYIQNRHVPRSYPIADAFAAIAVSKVRIFVKLEYANQYAITSTYYTTVFYPSTLFGVRGGVHWRFYN